MAQQSETSRNELTTEEVLALAARFLSGPCEVQVRRSVSSGVSWLILGGILTALGGFLSYKVADGKMDNAGAVVGLIFLLPGLYHLLKGFVWVVDRSPALILAADALVDCRSHPPQRYTWDNIRQARLFRATRNSSETSATLTLSLHEAVDGRREVRISLADLTHTSQGIFQLIGKRANLS
jgi:hypothetical protein